MACSCYDLEVRKIPGYLSARGASDLFQSTLSDRVLLVTMRFGRSELAGIVRAHTVGMLEES